MYQNFHIMCNPRHQQSPEFLHLLRLKLRPQSAATPPCPPAPGNLGSPFWLMSPLQGPHGSGSRVCLSFRVWLISHDPSHGALEVHPCCSVGQGVFPFLRLSAILWTAAPHLVCPSICELGGGISLGAPAFNSLPRSGIPDPMVIPHLSF